MDRRTEGQESDLENESVDDRVEDYWMRVQDKLRIGQEDRRQKDTNLTWKMSPLMTE